MRWFYLLAMVIPLFLFGCMSSVKNIGRSEFTGTPGAIETIEVGTIDWMGQNLKVLAVREEDGNGGWNTQYFAQGGNGFLTHLSPAAVSAVGFYAGMEALDPPEGDEITFNDGDVNAQGGDFSGEVSANAEGLGGNANSVSDATSASESSAEAAAAAAAAADATSRANNNSTNNNTNNNNPRPRAKKIQPPKPQPKTNSQHPDPAAQPPPQKPQEKKPAPPPKKPGN